MNALTKMRYIIRSLSLFVFWPLDKLHSAPSNKAVIKLVFVFGLLSATYAQTPNINLIAHYPFNGNALDVTGNGNNGTIVGGVVLSADRFGNPNSAYAFNGSTGYIDLNNDFDFAQRTISLWAYTNSISSGRPHLYISDNPSLNHGFTQIINNTISGNPFIRTSAGVGGTSQINHPITLSNWHMVTISVDIDSVRHYLDGQHM